MTTEQTNTERKEHGKKIEDGSPITVGGGGGLDDKDKTEGKNKCTFNEADYPDPEPGGNPKKKIFRRLGWQIGTFKISKTTTGYVDYSALLPTDRVCDIEVKCKGSGDDVTIISDGSSFGINMDTGTYKDKHDNVHENPDTSSYIYRVELKGKGFSHHWDYSRADNCKVCADHIANSLYCV